MRPSVALAFRYLRLVMLPFVLFGRMDEAKATGLSVPLLNGSVLTLDGLDLIVSGCVYTVNGTVSAGGCSAASAELASVSGSYLSFILDHSAGGDLFSNVRGPGNSLELNFNLLVARTAGNTTAYVTSDTATLNMTGGGGANILDNVTASNSSTSPAFNIALSGAVVPTTGNASFGVTAAFTLNVDAAVTAHDNSANHALSLNSVAMRLTPAPEPATVGIFLVGLAGLHYARSRRRRSPERPGRTQTATARTGETNDAP
jgi:hypothetical protein